MNVPVRYQHPSIKNVGGVRKNVNEVGRTSKNMKLDTDRQRPPGKLTPNVCKYSNLVLLLVLIRLVASLIWCYCPLRYISHNDNKNTQIYKLTFRNNSIITDHNYQPNNNTSLTCIKIYENEKVKIYSQYQQLNVKTTNLDIRHIKIIQNKNLFS